MSGWNGRNHARRERSERQIIAAIQREVLNGTALDELAERRRIRLDQLSGLAGDGDLLGYLADFECDVNAFPWISAAASNGP